MAPQKAPNHDAICLGATRGISKLLNMKGKFGAGEGIRTLDPNLGKVVLYP